MTGADGLLGSNLVRLLLEAGHTVRVFLQEGKKSPTLDGLTIERVYGDIIDPQALARSFKGSHAVIHAAANTSIWPSRSALVSRINIDGTANAIAAAESAQVDRFVYIGTANSFGPGTMDHPGNETSPYTGSAYGLDYIDSKYEAQRLVLDAVKTRRLPAVSVNPTFMIGPYDSTPSSGTMLIRLYQGKVPGYTQGGKCWSHVHDIATAVANACSMGRVGESYIAGNRNMSYGDFFDLAADIMGVRSPKAYIPRPLALFVGMSQSIASFFTKKPPLLSYTAARIGCDEFYYDTSKAREELAMPSTPLEQAVQESFAWLKANGYLEASR